MKILQICSYYHPHIGGIEQVTRDCSCALSGDNELKVFCFNTINKNATDNVDGVEIIRAGSFLKVASQSLSFSYGKLLKKTFKSFKPDLVIFHHPNPFSAHYLLKQLKKYRDCKLVVYWHLDITKQKILGKLFKGQTKRLLKRAEKVVATSPNYIEHSAFLPAVKDKCVVIPCCVNGGRMTVDDGDRQEAEKIRLENQGKIVLFALGRHVPYKGLEYAVRAAKLLSDEFVLFIGGEGPLTSSLKEIAKGDSKVRFLGKIREDELKAYMLACDIFCFPSITKNEAFGIALAEAMSLGKPAVTFTVEGSGINYVSLNGVTGLEAENRNIEQYAQAIQTLAKDGELRKAYGAAAAARVNELFTQKIFTRNVQSLVKGL